MPSGHGHPPITQLFVCVLGEATCVRADHRDAEELELENPLQRVPEMTPSRCVVAI